MDICPHCGEYIDSDAKMCPHCGSDDETGWKGDLDYYSVELPEDDYSYEQRGRPEAPVTWSDWPGYLLVGVGLAALVGIGFSRYQWGVLLPLAFLGLCALVCKFGARRPNHKSF